MRELHLKVFNQGNRSYRYLKITAANELLNMKEILIKSVLGTGQIFSTRQFLLINHLIGLTMTILQQTRVQRHAVLTNRNLQEKMRQ